MAVNTPAEQLFDLLVTKNFDPELLNSAGMPSENPAETEVFSFDWTAESGNDYGTVVIMLGNDSNLDVYFGDNLGRSMEAGDKQEWFSFLEQLKNFATRNMLSFGTKNLNRLRYGMQSQAAVKESIFESWTGTRTTSWNGHPQEARLMIKHKRPLGETDARFRYVENLFIETAEGERYKLPFTKLSGGRAMVEHVRNGGRPYDARGLHITEMVSELNVLSRFRRANHGKIFEGDTAQLVEDTNAYYEGLQRTLKSLSGNRGYTTYFEAWQPNEITEQEVVIEGLKHLFVTQSLDTRIEDALPLLAKIREQGTAMKEATIFEAWANRLVEGTWSLPDTPEKQQQLVDLLSQELPVGADATNATEQLYDLLGDDELFDQLQALADQDANADARQVIYDRMQELSDDPDVQKVINSLNIDADLEIDTPESAPADLEPQEPVQESDLEDCDSIGGDESDSFIRDVSKQQKELAEDSLKSIRRAAGLLTETELKENVLVDDTGSTLQHIKDTFKRDVKDFEETGEISQSLHDALYDYYFDDMPYGVQKARDGDPYEWVADRFGSDLGLSGYGSNSPGIGPEDDPSLERESVMHGDYAEEAREPHSVDGGMENPLIQDEGVVGAALGGIAGAVVGGPVGAVRGAMAGDAIGDAISPDETNENDMSLFDDATCNMSEAGESCPVHGVEECWGSDEASPLAGQYGHSGKMKEVGKETSFLDRLKELSGMIRH